MSRPNRTKAKTALIVSWTEAQDWLQRGKWTQRADRHGSAGQHYICMIKQLQYQPSQFRWARRLKNGYIEWYAYECFPTKTWNEHQWRIYDFIPENKP